MPRPDRQPDPIKGALAGAAAGLAAAFAMNMLQTFADRRSRKDPADAEAVGYVAGAALGALYGVAAEYRPQVTRGSGTAFGSTVAIILDAGAAPARRRSRAFASRWVFGTTAELTRRLLRR